MLNEYLRLLARRESKEVLGKKSANLWLLTAVLAATFISIAFSNGSMIYLDEKMNDPFTNWVDIKNNKTGGTARLVRDLDDEALRERFLYDNVQQDHINSLIFQGRTGQDCYLEIRFFEHLQGKIVEAVMNPDNLVGGARVPSEGLNDETVGVILSESALTRLGFSEDSIPAYVDHKSYAVGPNVDPAFVPGFRDGFAPVALPVLGVVRRLPGNVDMIASTYLFKLRQDNSEGGYQLSVGQHPEYLRSLVYYIPDAVADSDFTAAVAAAVPDSLAGAYRILDNPSAKLASWMPGRIKGVFFDERTVDVSAYYAASQALAQHYDDTDVKRLYDFARLKNNTLGQGNYISVVFNSLDSIRSFEAFAKGDAYRVQLEMAQVSSKENFNAVSVMANILSWAMIVFSMVCIIMFIVNMLQSYFQKVRRNLGTFKAFGISSGELIKVYVLIILAIIVAAIVIALGVAWLVQVFLPLMGVLKDGTFNYLSLWSVKTVVSVLVMIVATVVTVVAVMRKLLRRTPGDLIYDRN